MSASAFAPRLLNPPSSPSFVLLGSSLMPAAELHPYIEEQRLALMDALQIPLNSVVSADGAYRIWDARGDAEVTA